MLQNTYIPLPMPIITPRMILRLPQPGEGRKMYHAIKESYDELCHWMPWATPDLTEEQAEEFVRQSRTNWNTRTNRPLGLPMFMFEKTDLIFIGAINPHTIYWDVLAMELGYWIRTPYSGYGYMTEAVNAVTQYAFKQMHAARVEIRCEPDNIKSRKIPERLGYRQEAILKSNHRRLVTNELADAVIYARNDLEELPELEVAW